MTIIQHGVQSATGATNGSRRTRWICGTPNLPARMGFKLESLAWDRRTFRYAFSTPPGSSGTRPQTMTVKEVSDAVRLACDEWSKVDVQLGFEEVGLTD